MMPEKIMEMSNFLLKEADQCAYLAKREGKGKIRFMI
jgi:GGDEF domain-containing protein